MPTASAPQKKLSYADYAQIPQDGNRHEVLDGEHFVSPAPSLRHQMLLFRLHRVLEEFVAQHRSGWVFGAPVDVLLSANDVVQPDLVFVAQSRKAVLTAANVQAAPDLAVEILSPGNHNYDRENKFQRYERLAVGEYWIVDPDNESVIAFRLCKGRYAPVEIAGNRLQTPLLPGFQLDIPALFADLPQFP